MSLSKQLAKHLRDVHFGGNWSTVDLKNTLSDVTWEEANAKVHGLNSIVAITSHMTYYLDVLATVLQDGILVGKDAESWIYQPLQASKEWEIFQQQIWEKAEKVALLIEELSDEQLIKDFVDSKYGTNYRNIAGIIEHMHYHLGQVVIIKMILTKQE